MAGSNYLALDIGERRIGVALARADSRLPAPLLTLPNDAQFAAKLQQLIGEHEIGQLVVGLPRNLQGEPTAQTAYVEAFINDLQPPLELPIAWQDEALTSRKAEAELEQRGKPYPKEAIDALAATYILDDYLQTHPEEKHA